jgi:vacuolar-type H+-ATPase subunit F/Vma7
VVEAVVRETKRVIVVASRENASFYKLLGLGEVRVVGNPSETLKELEGLKFNRDVGIILVEESIMQALKVDHMSFNEKGLTPLVTVIPNVKDYLTRDPNMYYRKFVLKVTGYEVST